MPYRPAVLESLEEVHILVGIETVAEASKLPYATVEVGRERNFNLPVEHLRWRSR